MRHRFETTKDKCMAAHKITTVVPHVLQNIKPSIKHRRYIPASWTGHFWLPSLHVCSLSLPLSPRLYKLSLLRVPPQTSHIAAIWAKPRLSPQHIQTHRKKCCAVSRSVSHTHGNEFYKQGGFSLGSSQLFWHLIAAMNKAVRYNNIQCLESGKCFNVTELDWHIGG